METRDKVNVPEQRFDIRILSDGRWEHEGRVIPRPALVRLFASVLKRDADGGYWLETPAELGRIEVEDSPFTIVEVWRADDAVWFRTNLDDVGRLDADHPLRMAEAADGPRAYVEVRAGLEGRLLRAAFYDLVELGERRGESLGVVSAGTFFVLGEVE